MLKNITLGQYYPVASPLHAMDPRVKLTLALLYMILIFAATTPLAFAMLGVFVVCAVLLSGVPFTLLLRSLRSVALFVLITACINMLFTPGEPIWTFYFITITYEGVRFTIFMTLRILFLLTSTTLVTLTTTPIMLTDAMERLMSPLKLIRVPTHAIAMMMTIALRFIPTLFEETEKIMKAQAARGADFESGNFMQRAKAMIPLMVPLFVSSFRRADELATAMESRCYRGDDQRTRYRQLRVTRTDVLYATITVAYFTAVCVVAFTIR